ncbi:MAG: calcium-translocating P-type ATPase, PMCA-type [Clostridia bacterium]|nr:calcium-translocating P-type ATPase, PMCA-type [Clostridia bacterium]
MTKEREKEAEKFWAIKTDSVLEKVESNVYGLTSEEAEKRLEKFGKNTFEVSKKNSFIKKILSQLSDKMIIILMISAFISFAASHFSGEKDYDWVTILAIVAVNSIIGAVQENKAENAMEALKKLTAPEATVLRNGQRIKIKAEEIVVGDIVIVEKGDVAPADIRLIKGEFIASDESSLTGESVEAHKDAYCICNFETHISDMENMLWAGCPIVSGKGEGVVVATGINSRVGAIAHSLSKSEKEKTPLQKKLASVSTVLGNSALIICVIIFIFSLIKKMPAAEMFLTSVSLAVAAIPEGLPAIVTVVLSLGMQKMAKRKAVVKSLPAVETLGCAEVICTDKTGTLTKNKMTVTEEWGEIEKIRKISILCNDFNSPTENALKEYAEKNGYNSEKFSEYKRINEIPFDSSKKYMITVHKGKNGCFISLKGAPETVFTFCKGDKNIYVEKSREMAKKALRVMAFAFAETKNVPDIKNMSNIEFVFSGLVGIKDPIKDGVRESVKKCKTAGIKIVMITGDHPETAKAIAEEAGFSSPSVLTEKELKGQSSEERRKNILKNNVFARVTPEFKVEVVETYKKAGFTVAMTGDGVNDAPALKNSDIGCAMGISGTEVAKEAADIVLTDDNFSTIVEAVEQGRGIYANIRRSVHFLLSCNIGEILVVLCAILASFPSPLAAIQLLWVNLVTDSLPAIALGMEKTSSDVMKNKPIRKKEGIFSDGMGLEILFGGVVIGILSLSAYILGLKNGDQSVGRTMAFAVLSLSQLFHSFNMRKGSIFSNLYLLGSFVICTALQLSVMIVPKMMEIFKTVALSPSCWRMVILLSAASLVIGKISSIFKK